MSVSTFLAVSAVAQVCLNDDTSPAVTIDKPTGTVEGDLLIAIIAVDSNATADSGWTQPSGWTLIRKDGLDANSYTMMSAYKVAGGAEPASYTFELTGLAVGADTGFTGVILRYDNFVSAGPIDAHAGTIGSNGTGPSVTTTKQATTVLSAMQENTQPGDGSATPSGWTSRVNAPGVSLCSPANAVCPRLQIAEKDFSPAGATGTIDWDNLTAAQLNQTLAIKPDRQNFGGVTVAVI